MKETSNIIVKNRKASHEYEFVETLEAGIALTGTEVKAIRDGKINISDAWVKIENNEAHLMQAHISPYSHGNIYNHAEQRPRKLLLKKSQLRKLAIMLQSRGFTIIPLKVYTKGQFIKIEIVLAHGKKEFDKRQDTKEREAKRDMDRALKDRKK